MPEVVDELRKVLDRVDVVVRRRRDEGHTGSGVTYPGDDLVYLVAGKVSALARLRPLRHLDLNLVGAQ